MFEYVLLAFALGFKHSFDADHLVAVSNLLAKARSFGNALKLSMNWAVGHMLTAIIITGFLFSFKDTILSSVLGYFEIIVAFMLVILGIVSIYHAFYAEESKEDYKHPHEKNAFGIGIIHGLASNDELFILITASLGLTSFADRVFGVGIFSMGVVVGMCLYAIFCSIPFIAARSKKFHQILHGSIGIMSLLYGLFLLIHP